MFPSSVITDSTGYKALNYASLVAPLIEAVKELADESHAIREELEALRVQNEVLRADLCRRDPASPICGIERN